MENVVMERRVSEMEQKAREYIEKVLIPIVRNSQSISVTIKKGEYSNLIPMAYLLARQYSLCSQMQNDDNRFVYTFWYSEK